MLLMEGLKLLEYSPTHIRCQRTETWCVSWESSEEGAGKVVCDWVVK